MNRSDYDSAAATMATYLRERNNTRMTISEMEAHPMVRVASSGSWLDSAR